VIRPTTLADGVWEKTAPARNNHKQTRLQYFMTTFNLHPAPRTINFAAGG
jgi:hypothetical protein